MERNNIFVVMPAYNESGRIGKLLKSLPKSISVGKRRFALQPVVVDDASRDATYDEALAAGATVMRHVMNCGAGAATRTGLRYAEQNAKGLAYVVTIDADGQHSVEDIKKIVSFAERRHAAMVVGNRLHSGNKEHMPLHRTIGNRGISFICRILFGIKTEDTQSGLRLFDADIIPKISKYSIDRYGFCTEMLWLAGRAGIVIHEMPIGVRYSKESLTKGQNNWGVFDLILDLLWVRISE